MTWSCSPQVTDWIQFPPGWLCNFHQPVLPHSFIQFTSAISEKFPNKIIKYSIFLIVFILVLSGVSSWLSIAFLYDFLWSFFGSFLFLLWYFLWSSFGTSSGLSYGLSFGLFQDPSYDFPYGHSQGWDFAHSLIAHLLKSLRTNERMWAICSGHSGQMSNRRRFVQVAQKE